MIELTRPTHYHVLLDEVGFSPDDLQEIVHSLSYVYQHSNTAISIVNMNPINVLDFNCLLPWAERDDAEEGGRAQR
ncbi:Protein argonaute 4B [Orobanche minor]